MGDFVDLTSDDFITNNSTNSNNINQINKYDTLNEGNIDSFGLSSLTKRLFPPSIASNRSNIPVVNQGAILRQTFKSNSNSNYNDFASNHNKQILSGYQNQMSNYSNNQSNGHLRVFPQSLQVNNPIIQHGLQKPPSHPYGASLSYRPMYPSIPSSYATITFVLLNPKEFYVKSDNGLIPKDALRTLTIVNGFRFDSESKRLIFPLAMHENLAVALTNLKLHIEPIPKTILALVQLQNRPAKSLNNNTSNSNDSNITLKERLPEHLYNALAEFQREGVEFAIQKEGRLLIADEMGLGKTRSAIATAACFKDSWPILIVCPSSARHHWLNEINSLLYPDSDDTRDKVLLIENANQNIIKKIKHEVVIISYSLVVRMIEKISSFGFDVIIADESHYLKNSKAKRTKVLLPIIIKCKRAILLSGTPALSRPIELFTQLHALDNKSWPDEKLYGKRYCKLKKSMNGQKTIGFGQEYKGASNTKELHVILSNTLMIRRLKKDILSQLPKKIRNIIKVEVTNESKKTKLREILEQIKEKEKLAQEKKKMKKDKMLSNPSNNDLTAINEERKFLLMQLFTQSGEAKLPGILKHIDDFLNDPLSGKILIFAHHRNILDRISEHIDSKGIDSIRIDGRTNSKDRQAKAQYFQTNSLCRVGILSITAAGIAITLTAAATVYFVEIFWTPGSLVQAEDRAHRIGQNNIVRVTYFLADNTIDELLWPLVRQKMKTLGEVVEGQDDIDLNTTKETSTNKKSSDVIDLENNVIDDLEDVANEIAEVCTDLKKKSNADDEDDDDDNEDEDNDAITNNTSTRNNDVDNFEKSLEDDKEEPDQLAIMYMRQIALQKTQSRMNFPNNINSNINNSYNMSAHANMLQNTYEYLAAQKQRQSSTTLYSPNYIPTVSEVVHQHFLDKKRDFNQFNDNSNNNNYTIYRNSSIASTVTNTSTNQSNDVIELLDDDGDDYDCFPTSDINSNSLNNFNDIINIDDSNDNTANDENAAHITYNNNDFTDQDEFEGYLDNFHS